MVLEPVLANEFWCDAGDKYYAIPSSYTIGDKIPEGKLPCINPVYLLQCQDIQVRSNLLQEGKVILHVVIVLTHSTEL